MIKLGERAAYLQGLVNGADFKPDDKTKVVWDSLLTYCTEVAEAYDHLADRIKDLEDYLRSIDEDLAQLEDDFYQDEFIDAGEEENTTFYEISCPNCQENLCIEEEVMAGQNVEVLCPTCGDAIYIVDKKGTETAISMVKKNPETH